MKPVDVRRAEVTDAGIAVSGTGRAEARSSTNFLRVPQHTLSQPFVLGIAVYLLLWVAIFNGYPTVFHDTGEYLAISVSPWQSPYRSIIYSLFMRLASWGMTPWLIVLAQCAMTIYVLRAFVAYLLQHSAAKEYERVVFVGLVTFLAFATSLPWFVGQLMPDVFTGLAFLSAFLLLYDSNLSFETTVVLSAVLTVAIGSHLSNFPSLGLVLAAVLVLRAFDGARQFWPTQSVKRIVAFVLLPILLSAGTIIVSNYHRNYGITLSTGTPVFLFSRLLESRLADDYLEQQCKIEQLKSCKYLQDLPRTTFLWGPHPLITEMGGWLGARAESKQIVYGTLRRHPFQFLAECGKQMFRQFVAFEPGVDQYPYEAGPTVDAIQRLYPGDAPKFQLTKQQSGRLHLLAEKLSRWYEVVFWTALVGCAVLFLRRYARSSPANRLFLTVLIFLFANALVTASVSLVAHRLQSRVSWIIVLCCAAYGVDRECSTRSTK